MTPSIVPPPPVPFPPANLHHVAAGTILHRNHASEFAPDAFNPCQGQPTRFAPVRQNGHCVPSLYAATTEEAAAFETVFHDIAPTASFKTVRREVVATRCVSTLAPRRSLALVALFAPDLHTWGLTRGELIETPRSTYAATAAWAKAIHAAHPTVDGLAWTSRQCDPAICLLLFGDRVSAADLHVVSRQDARDPAVLLRLRGYGRRAGITLI